MNYRAWDGDDRPTLQLVALEIISSSCSSAESECNVSAFASLRTPVRHMAYTWYHTWYLYHIVAAHDLTRGVNW
jgi:hypothetical protein